MYLALMTAKERILYEKMYNVARGLCLNAKQDKTTRHVRRRAKNIEQSVARYLNHVKRIQVLIFTTIFTIITVTIFTIITIIIIIMTLITTIIIITITNMTVIMSSPSKL
jgi:uncharacterized membrane protein